MSVNFKELTVCIELSDETATATKTALNRVDEDDIADEICVMYGETSIDEDDRDVALNALESHRIVLKEAVGRATLFDPNDENEYLEWIEKAIAELSE